MDIPCLGADNVLNTQPKGKQQVWGSHLGQTSEPVAKSAGKVSLSVGRELAAESEP